MPEQLKTNVLYNAKGQAVYLEDKEVADKISTEGVDNFAELIDNKVDKVDGKGLSTNDFTDAEKVKLAALGNYDDSELTAALSNKVDKVSGKGLSTEDFTTAEKQKLTTVYTSQEVDALLANKVSTSVVGEAGGVASLGNDGKVPSSQLPSYVDDVLEYANKTSFPETGEAGKIYVALNTNKTFRWGGSAYTPISESIALGETSGTAYEGDKGKANADAISAIKDGTTIDSFGDVETALGGKVDTETGKGLSSNDFTDALKTKLEGISAYDDTALAGRVSDIEDVIPSTATASNKLATVADIPSQQTITIDSALDGTSTNPVQNSVVKNALDGKEDKDDDIFRGTVYEGVLKWNKNDNMLPSDWTLYYNADEDTWGTYVGYQYLITEPNYNNLMQYQSGASYENICFWNGDAGYKFKTDSPYQAQTYGSDIDYFTNMDVISIRAYDTENNSVIPFSDMDFEYKQLFGYDVEYLLSCGSHVINRYVNGNNGYSQETIFISCKNDEINIVVIKLGYGRENDYFKNELLNVFPYGAIQIKISSCTKISCLPQFDNEFTRRYLTYAGQIGGQTDLVSNPEDFNKSMLAYIWQNNMVMACEITDLYPNLMFEYSTNVDVSAELIDKFESLTSGQGSNYSIWFAKDMLIQKVTSGAENSGGYSYGHSSKSVDLALYSSENSSLTSFTQSDIPYQYFNNNGYAYKIYCYNIDNGYFDDCAVNNKLDLQLCIDKLNASTNVNGNKENFKIMVLRPSMSNPDNNTLCSYVYMFPYAYYNNSLYYRNRFTFKTPKYFTKVNEFQDASYIGNQKIIETNEITSIDIVDSLTSRYVDKNRLRFVKGAVDDVNNTIEMSLYYGGKKIVFV